MDLPSHRAPQVSQWWSWILGLNGVIALYVIGRRWWFGWAMAFANECLWLIYGTLTRQWGFVFAAVCYGAINAHNGNKWRNSDQRRD